MLLQRCSWSQRALASCSPAMRAAGFGAVAGVIGGSLSLLQPVIIDATVAVSTNDVRNTLTNLMGFSLGSGPLQPWDQSRPNALNSNEFSVLRCPETF